MNIQKLIVQFEKKKKKRIHLFMSTFLSLITNSLFFWQFCIKKKKIKAHLWDMRARRDSPQIIHPCANTWKWPENSFVCLNRCRPLSSLTRGNVFFFPVWKDISAKRKKFSAVPLGYERVFLIFSAEDSERVFARYVGFRLFLIDLGQSWKWHKYHEGSGPRKLSSKLCCLLLSEYEAQVFLRRNLGGGGRNGHNKRAMAVFFFCFFSSRPVHNPPLCNYKPESFFCVADLQPKRNPTCTGALIFWFSG